MHCTPLEQGKSESASEKALSNVNQKKKKRQDTCNLFNLYGNYKTLLRYITRGSNRNEKREEKEEDRNRKNKQKYIAKRMK